MPSALGLVYHYYNHHHNNHYHHHPYRRTAIPPADHSDKVVLICVAVLHRERSSAVTLVQIIKSRQENNYFTWMCMRKCVFAWQLSLPLAPAQTISSEIRPEFLDYLWLIYFIL